MAIAFTCVLLFLIVTIVLVSYYIVWHSDREISYHKGKVAELSERNDRLTEALVSAVSGGASQPLLLPRPQQPTEKSETWFQNDNHGSLATTPSGGK
jgi:hypothetical protein